MPVLRLPKKPSTVFVWTSPIYVFMCTVADAAVLGEVLV
jgi:hypothetical protein